MKLVVIVVIGTAITTELIPRPLEWSFLMVERKQTVRIRKMESLLHGHWQWPRNRPIITPSNELLIPMTNKWCNRLIIPKTFIAIYAFGTFPSWWASGPSTTRLLFTANHQKDSPHFLTNLNSITIAASFVNCSLTNSPFVTIGANRRNRLLGGTMRDRVEMKQCKTYCTSMLWQSKNKIEVLVINPRTVLVFCYVSASWLLIVSLIVVILSLHCTVLYYTGISISNGPLLLLTSHFHLHFHLHFQ